MTSDCESRCFLIQFRGPTMTREDIAQIRNRCNTRPMLFPRITQLYTLQQDDRTTLFVGTRDRRATNSVRSTLESMGLAEVRVVAVRTEHMTPIAMPEYYSGAAVEMFRLLRANPNDVVRFVRPGWNRPYLFGARSQPRASAASSMALRSADASRAQSPAPEPPSSSSSSEDAVASPRSPPRSFPSSPSSASSLSNLGTGPVSLHSPRYQPRNDPFANDPQHVVDLRAYLSAHGTQDPEFNPRVMRFAAAHLRTMDSDVARELLGVLEPTGEPFVREFRAYINTHDHTHADFQGQLTRLVQAYLTGLHPNRDNYNFAMRMFAAFGTESDERARVFRELIARIAADVPLARP